MNAIKFKKKLHKLLSIKNPSIRKNSILEFLKINEIYKEDVILSILENYESLKEKSIIDEIELIEIISIIMALTLNQYNFIKRPYPIIPDKLKFNSQELEDLRERDKNPNKDPMNLTRDLKLLFNFTHNLFLNEEYELIAGLGYPALIGKVKLEVDRFRNFEVIEYPGYKSIEKIILSSNLPLDIKRFTNEVLTSYFLINEVMNSTEFIKEILLNFSNVYTNLEGLIPILNVSEEDLKDFLLIWIEYLLNNPEDFRHNFLNQWSRTLHSLYFDEQLINEALKLLDNSAYYEDFIIKHIEDHPDLYAYYLIEEIQDKDKKVSLAKKAFETLEEKPDVRKRILKEVTPLLNEVNNGDLKKELATLEEFYVYPCFIRYMELIENDLLESPEVRKKISRIIGMDPSKFFWNERESQLPLLLVLNRDFDQAIKMIKEVPVLYGDGRENIPLMVTLMFYLLYQGEELPESLNEKIDYIDRYYFQNDKFVSLKNQSSNLKELLAKWKLSIPEEEIDEEWLFEFHKFIFKHIELLQTKFMPLVELETLALFVAILGEVLESRNFTTKQDYMEKFRDRFSEDHYFVEDLEKYGLKKN